MMKNKRGISAIVATVLIILITVAAVTIIWAAIIPLISNQLDKGTICLDAISQLQTVTKDGYTCVDRSGTPQNISVQVKRGSKDFDLAGVQFLVSAGGETVSDTRNSNLPSINEEKVFTGFAFPPNGTASFTYDKGDLVRVQIAPIVKVGSGEEICEVSSEALNDSIPYCP